MFVLPIHITQTNLVYPVQFLGPLFIQIIDLTDEQASDTYLLLSSRPKACSNFKSFYHGDVPLLFSSPDSTFQFPLRGEIHTFQLRPRLKIPIKATFM